MKRWRHAIARAIAHSKPNCIGRAAKSCSSATPPIPHPPKKPPDRHRRREAARHAQFRACAQRYRWPSSINRPAAPPKRTPSSRPRSKVFRRRPKCPRSLRRRRCLMAVEAGPRGRYTVRMVSSDRKLTRGWRHGGNPQARGYPSRRRRRLQPARRRGRGPHPGAPAGPP